MRGRIFFSRLLITLMAELAVLIWFTHPKAEHLQDTVTVNEIIQTVQNDWNYLETHSNHTTLDYVVLDSDGAVLYRTKTGLSESINMAVSHKDTILDIEVDGSVVGAALAADEKTGRIIGRLFKRLIRLTPW